MRSSRAICRDWSIYALPTQVTSVASHTEQCREGIPLEAPETADTPMPIAPSS